MARKSGVEKNSERRIQSEIKLFMNGIMVLFDESGWILPAIGFGLLGAILGTWATLLIQYLTTDAPSIGLRCPHCQHPQRLSRLWLPGRSRAAVCVNCQQRSPRWLRIVILASASLCALHAVAYFEFHSQQIGQVVPYPHWYIGRAVYHVLLIVLLVCATATDLIDYTIPDLITMPGLAIGLIGATATGDFQMVHLWIDWNQETLFEGAYIPAWMAASHHWHGLAWSATGAAVGAAGTWILRLASSRIMGQEALGLGDVTLMAMIGSFVGWQPVCWIFLIAPVLAATVGVVIPFLTGKPYLPFGPFLSLAAYTVLIGWRWMWEPTRYIFGHPGSLAVLAATALGGTTLLLSLLRLVHRIPTDHVKRARGRHLSDQQPD